MSLDTPSTRIMGVKSPFSDSELVPIIRPVLSLGPNGPKSRIRKTVICYDENVHLKKKNIYYSNFCG